MVDSQSRSTAEQIYGVLPSLLRSPEAWDEVVRIVAQSSEASFEGLYCYGPAGEERVDTANEVVLSRLNRRILPQFDRFIANYKHLNAGIKRYHPSGQTGDSFQIRLDFGGSPIGIECSAGVGYWLDISFYRRQQKQLRIRLVRTASQGPFCVPDLDKIDEYKEPLTLATEMYLHINCQRVANGLNEEMLNQVSMPLVIVDQNLRIIFSNRKAKFLFQEDDGISIKDNRLTMFASCISRQLDHAFEAFIQSCHKMANEDTNTDKFQNHFFVPRPSGKPHYLMKFVSLEAQLTQSMLIGGGVLVFITDPVAIKEPPLAYLKEIYSLTNSEIMVAEKLMQGLDSQGIARCSGKKTTTIRQNIKSIMAKTGHKKQTELVALLSNLA